ncbi:MAG: ATP-binding protein [Vitreimonas sp.]
MYRRAIITGLVALAPTIVFAAMVGAARFQEERADREAAALATAREVNAHVDGELDAALGALSVLATSTGFLQRDWTRARVRAEGVMNRNPDWRDVYLTDALARREIWSASERRSARSARPDAQAYIDALAPGQRVGNVGGIAPGCPCVVLHQPIMEGDRLRYVLSVEFGVDRMQAWLDRAVQTPNVGGIVDRRGHFIARTVSPRARLGEPGSTYLRAAIANAPSGVYEGTTLEGLRNRTAYETSALSGFSTHVAVPRSGLSLLGAGSLGLQVLAVLLALAAAVAGALYVLREQERWRSEERRRAQSEKLAATGMMNRVGEAVRAERDLDEAVQLITDCATELTEAAFGAFFYNVIDNNGESYMLYAISGAPREAFANFSMPRNTAVFAPTFNGEALVRSDDITKDERYGKNAPYHGMPEGHLAVRSYLAASVISRSGEVLGGLFFGHPEPARFNKAAEQVAAGIATQAAIAIDNARLYRAMQREIAQRTHAEAELKHFNEDLETRIEKRTSQLQEANRQFRLLVEGVVDYAIYRLDSTGAINSWNAGAERIKGYAAEEIIGQHFSVFFTPEDQAAGLPERILETARREGRFETQGVRVRKNGSRFRADVVINALHNHDGAVIGFAKVTRDVTERVETQARLQRVQEQLAQSQKMEALGQLTGGMAHDFNNMLSVVTGAFQLTRRAMAKNESDRALQFIESGMDGAARAAELVRRLLAFARKQPLAPKVIDANQLVRDIAEILRRTLGEQVELETVLAGGLWPLRADQNQLENTLLNLATNARDAMPSGGKLTIETSNAHLDDRYAAQHAEVSPGQYVLIAVTDTGAGMTAEQISKAFEPFYTTKGVGGSGLGLAQVYGFAKQSEGHARIYSEPGRGTTVKVYLPRAQGAPTQSPAHRESEVPLGRADQTILVVEDEPRVRQLTVAGLRELGYTVVEADGGEAALEILGQRAEISLVFTDVVMPHMDGRVLADEVLRRRPELKVLFTTGFTKNAIIHGGVLDPGTNFIAKPFTLDDLARKVREVLEG